MDRGSSCAGRGDRGWGDEINPPEATLSCIQDRPPIGAEIPDAVAAAAFRRLLAHLAHRRDAQNVDLMGLAGFCRNCLSDWVAEAGGGDREAARDQVYGMAYAAWKKAQPPATPEQLARMEASLARNAA